MLKHIVKKNPRFKPAHYFVFFAIIIIIIIWYLYDNPRLNAIRTQLSQVNDINILLNANMDLRKQNKELSEKNLKIERLANVDNETSIGLQNEIKSLQEQIFNLRRELTFYQGIITASSYSNGLNIQGLHIESTHKKGFFKYKLVLTNIGKSDKMAEVSVDIKVEGNDKSGFRTLKLNEISAGAGYKERIKIRNFERIDGSFDMPDGFQPLRVLVDLKQHGGEKLRLHRVFEWQTGET
jgi:hypothetical protein